MPKKRSITVSVPLPFTVSIPPSNESMSASRGGVCNGGGGTGLGGGAGLGGGGAGLGGGGAGLGGGDTRCSPNWLLLFVAAAPTVTLTDPPSGVWILKSEPG